MWGIFVRHSCEAIAPFLADVGLLGLIHLFLRQVTTSLMTVKTMTTASHA
jgi:hypothetical protein